MHIFPDIFITGKLPENWSKELLIAEGLAGWACCMAGATLPSKFGEGMALISSIIGTANPNDLKKLADEFLDNVKKQDKLTMTFRDIYTLPLIEEEIRVLDSKGQWVLDFTFWDKEKQKLLLDVINGEKTLENKALSFHRDNGYICDSKGNRYILIRGWSNLIGKHGLSDEQAGEVQDSLAEYIVEQLNRRNYTDKDMEDFLIFVEDEFQYHHNAWFGRDNDTQYSIDEIIKLWKQKSI